MIGSITVGLKLGFIVEKGRRVVGEKTTPNDALKTKEKSFGVLNVRSKNEKRARASRGTKSGSWLCSHWLNVERVRHLKIVLVLFFCYLLASVVVSF